jgi:hypothetical protein
MRALTLAAALVGGIATVSSAEALPVTKMPSVDESSLATNVAWYCNGRGHCVQVRRPGYVVRGGWAPRCRATWRWNGYRCVAPGVTIRVR